MRKQPLQDVIVKSRNVKRRIERAPTKRAVDVSRRSVDMSSVRKKRLPEDDYNELNYEQSSEEEGRLPRRVRGPINTTNKRWLFSALGIGVIVILSSIVLSLMFAGATVTVYPKQDTVVVNASIIAGVTEDNQNVLVIENIVLERTAKRSVVALGEEEIEERAFGEITIFNKYSETPQRLIKNTRFKSSDNKIYRTRESVEVPGMDTNGDPGSIGITIYAEEPGQSYNMDSDTFSVPGFEGLPQEGLVYAKSEESFEGGFVGVRRNVSEEERMKTLEQLETQLRDDLLAAAFSNSDNPEGYHLFKEAVFFEFNSLPDEVADVDKVTLSLSGKLHGILFPRDELSNRIAKLTLSSYNGEKLRIENLTELSVTVSPNKDEEVDLPWQAAVFDVVVQGKAHFIWEFDSIGLANNFAGKDEEILNTPLKGGMLEGYPGIDRLEVSIRPFWKGSFPDKAEDIVVITELDD